MSGIEGYNSFLQFIENRQNDNRFWMSEIKAMFELNNKRHPVVKICSQGNGEPEAIFSINGQLGILEVAHIQTLFDSNFEKNKMINKETFFLNKKENDGKEFILSDNTTSVNIQETGIITRGKNADVISKVLRIYKEKRKQHKGKYSNHFKIYYFYIDFFNLWSLDMTELSNRLLRILHKDELLVLNAASTIICNNHGIQLPPKHVNQFIKMQCYSPIIDANNFDLSNIYFSEK